MKRPVRRGGASFLTRAGWLGGLGDLVSKAALIAGGVFAAAQFMETQKDARIGRTMEYILRFEDGRVGESRRAINAALRPYAPQFVSLEAEGGVDAETRKRIVSTLLEADPTLPDHIDVLTDFYEGLWTCVDAEVCARDVAFAYFSPAEAPELRDNFETYIHERRRNNPRYAAGLDQFAKPSPHDRTGARQ